MLSTLYRPNLSLLTDLYQLTMAYGYRKLRMAERPAVFHLYFRKPPFGGAYAVTAGLEGVIDWLNHFKFDVDSIQYLARLKGNNGQPLFDESFLNYLQRLTFSCDIDAMPEGAVAFPNEPLIRVKGPLLQAQLLETALLNQINFSTLIATKAGRIASAAGGDPVLEFGLRRAQGPDGGLSASRAAYIGGCAATSNVLAGRLFGIPVKGTHAHSWVMCFDSELESFEAYASAMPHNSIFLVDTYDTLEGVENAIRVGKQLHEKGYQMGGIRLDSGQMGPLSIQARRLLDEAGLKEAAIVASNDLDEYKIRELKEQGATISIWGVGTRLVTGYDQAALGGVYKLAALQDKDGRWTDKIKLSEQKIKTSIPGILNVVRSHHQGIPSGDLIVDERITPPNGQERLLIPVFREGKQVYPSPALPEIRAYSLSQQKLFKGISSYPVQLESELNQRRDRMIRALEGEA
jgi:nicotinate phosphoribosyltransferase